MCFVVWDVLTHCIVDSLYWIRNGCVRSDSEFMSDGSTEASDEEPHGKEASGHYITTMRHAKRCGE